MLNLEDLYLLRKKHCNCRKGFLWPTFHPEDCPYRKEGEYYISVREKETQELLTAAGEYMGRIGARSEVRSV